MRPFPGEEEQTEKVARNLEGNVLVTVPRAGKGSREMLTANVNFSDPGLFGNDAAEDEEEDIFNAYALKRIEVQSFSDPAKKIQIARAYKGEGKSALLRLAKGKLLADDPDCLMVTSTGASLSPDVKSADSDAWVRGWKERLFRQLASEVGSHIGMAWSDDAISLVEEAEKNGFKRKNIVSAVMDRFKHKSAEVAKPGATNPEQMLKRWMKGKTPLWFFVDDVDQNFQNTAAYRAKIASFFVACRQLVNLVPQFVIRAVVRPNVWTTVKRDHEALSHVEQYMVDLTWTDESIRQLLAHRIRGHFIRRGQEQAISDFNLRADAYNPEETLISLAFESPMDWGQRKRPPHIVLSTLSRRRPRWLIELCKSAAARVIKRSSTAVVTLGDLNAELPAFGKKRIDDTVAEFKAQCPEVGELIAAFAKQSERYKTADLITTITNRVLQAMTPHIAGVLGNPTPRDVAAFLFQIGFLSAREDRPDGTYEHVTYSDNPCLLTARTNIDQGLSWEIHPVFRQALGLHDRPPRKKK